MKKRFDITLLYLLYLCLNPCQIMGIQILVIQSNSWDSARVADLKYGSQDLARLISLENYFPEEEEFPIGFNVRIPPQEDCKKYFTPDCICWGKASENCQQSSKRRMMQNNNNENNKLQPIKQRANSRRPQRLIDDINIIILRENLQNFLMQHPPMGAPHIPTFEWITGTPLRTERELAMIRVKEGRPRSSQDANLHEQLHLLFRTFITNAVRPFFRPRPLIPPFLSYDSLPQTEKNAVNKPILDLLRPLIESHELTRLNNDNLFNRLRSVLGYNHPDNLGIRPDLLFYYMVSYQEHIETFTRRYNSLYGSTPLSSNAQINQTTLAALDSLMRAIYYAMAIMRALVMPTTPTTTNTSANPPKKDDDNNNGAGGVGAPGKKIGSPGGSLSNTGRLADNSGNQMIGGSFTGNRTQHSSSFNTQMQIEDSGCIGSYNRPSTPFSLPSSIYDFLVMITKSFPYGK